MIWQLGSDRKLIGKEEMEKGPSRERRVLLEAERMIENAGRESLGLESQGVVPRHILKIGPEEGIGN